jgi:hypothetical protein
MAEVDTDSTKAFIRDLKVQIDDRMQELCDKITRIRDDAKCYERDAVERAYAEIEPMRRQMEAMILTLADYESLRAPPPILIEQQI